MKEYTLKFDFKSKTVQSFRYAGFLLLGFFFGMVLVRLVEGLPISWVSWLSVLNGVAFALFIAFFPGRLKTHELTVNEEGIFTENYNHYFSDLQHMDWDKIRAVHIKKNTWFNSGYIKVTKTIGTTETIRLPMYRKSQFNEFVQCVKEIVEPRKIGFSQA